MAGALLRASDAARRYADVTLAALVVLMVGMMIVPLPTPVLDVLITGNVSIAVLLLLVAVYLKSGLQLSSFPTLLLLTTLYRLALNVSSTRLILLQADAGDVIRAFGEFVVSGNYVVGAVVFLILTLIQFIVIAKGSERVAEVGARFTLDAMPGKQMSIDAELRAGSMSQEEARVARAELQRESQFYGAMDGAMKFVKGDAIAGIVITLINILGGLTIGMAMRDMSAVDALARYGLLTIGDGLVSQIPALLISTAAGLVVTRVASEREDSSLGGDVARQIFGEPRALFVAAGFLALLAAVPGLPALPFLVLAGALFVVGRRVSARPATSAAEGEEEAALDPRVPAVEPIRVELGAGLEPLVLALTSREIPALRDALFDELGLPLPRVRATCSNALPHDGYVISLHEIPVARGRLAEGAALALASAAALAERGVPSHEAADPAGLGPAAFVDPTLKEPLVRAGVPVLGPEAVLARHLGAEVRRRAAPFLGLQETQAMLDQLERTSPALVRNVVPKPVPLALLADVLRRLVDEGVSVRPLREILEALAVHAATERDPEQLTERVRAALRPQITHRHARDGALSVFLLDPMIEETVRDGVQRSASGGTYLALPPDVARDVVGAVRRACPEGGVVLTQTDVRRFLRRLLEVELPKVVVLSHQELDPHVEVRPLARIQP
ncbi:MAG: type III secretion system export apparatus subunit SctV [Myxococcales bacterium]|nr:type III secretion system export apparatus subunit SctV [Myxococcales bacterium]